MNSFKNHLSLIFALTSLLISFQFFVSFSKIVSLYEDQLGSDYSVVVVAKKPLELQAIQRVIPYSTSLELIDPEFIIEEVKSSLSEANVGYLRGALPLFYRLKLDRYPSLNDRADIEKYLDRIDSVISIETFAKTQDKIYRLLLLNKTIILVFAVLMFVIAFLLIVRQMEVWKFEHTKRIQIMSVFGAPSWLRSAVLYRLAVISSLFSTAIVGGLFFWLSADSFIAKSLIEMELPRVEYDAIFGSLKLLALAFFISIGSVLYVSIKAQERDE